ncbi:uncharacterized protein [Ptychodera flava]|uniref:uncharacterized protein n=1 Tax=Ptychodera flava TaxID=63121 RepID=UPI00396A09F0
MILNCSCTLPVRLSPPNIQTAPVVPKPWRKRTTLGHDPSGCALHGGICKLNIRKLCVKEKSLDNATTSPINNGFHTSIHHQQFTGVVMSVVGGLAVLIVALIALVVFLWCRRNKLGHEYATPLPVRQYQTEKGNVSSVDIPVDQSGYTDLSQGNRLPEHAYQSLTLGGYGPHDGNHQSEDSYTELRDIPVAPYQSLRFEQALEQASDHGYTELTHDTELRTHEYEKLKRN